MAGIFGLAKKSTSVAKKRNNFLNKAGQNTQNKNEQKNFLNHHTKDKSKKFLQSGSSQANSIKQNDVSSKTIEPSSMIDELEYNNKLNGATEGYYDVEEQAERELKQAQNKQNQELNNKLSNLNQGIYEEEVTNPIEVRNNSQSQPSEKNTDPSSNKRRYTTIRRGNIKSGINKTEKEKWNAQKKETSDNIAKILNERANDDGKLGLADTKLKERLAQRKKEYDAMSRKDWEQFEKENKYGRKEAYKKLEESAKDGPSVGDYFYGYHGPTAVGLGLGTASVLALSNSRGQKSNAELYSDPFA